MPDTAARESCRIKPALAIAAPCFFRRTSQPTPSAPSAKDSEPGSGTAAKVVAAGFD